MSSPIEPKFSDGLKIEKLVKTCNNIFDNIQIT